MDRTTSTTLTMYEALHPKGNIGRLYLNRKHGGRSLISIEMCVSVGGEQFGFVRAWIE